MSLVDDVIEFIQGERQAVRKTFVARELARLSNIKLWPEATYEEWLSAVNDAVRAGRLIETDGNVWLAVKPAEETQDAPKQLELF